MTTTPRNEEKLREEWRKKWLHDDFEIFDQPGESIADWWLSHLETERTALIEEIRKMKWDDISNEMDKFDKENRIANYTHNKTIDDVLSHLESGNEEVK